jgi:diguanylate cyclase (GGDEF)-like protein
MVNQIEKQSDKCFHQLNSVLTIEESNKLLLIQQQILELTITGSDYQSILDELCNLIEGLVDGALASLLIKDVESECLYIRSAPNMPDEAISQLNGLQPSENAGSCGTAVFKNEPQFVFDTINDKRWSGFLPYIKEFEVFACWSVPILDRQKKVMGSVALSSNETREPNDFQKNILFTASKLISLILIREMEDQTLHHSAHYDALTNLANRTLFKLRFEQAVTRANRNHTPLAIFFMDLDGFKKINDQFGHDVGDKILVKVSNLLSNCIRREDSLARFGGDEFVLLVEDSESQLEIIANKIIKTCKEPIIIEEGVFAAELSIGISCYPEHGLIAKDLIRNADIAMYKSKRNKNKKKYFFSE